MAEKNGRPPPLREVIRDYGLVARKSLGQNFLLDANLVGRIARAAGDLTGVAVYEVGAGPGGLTRALLDAGAERVIAVEIDRRCLDALQSLAAFYPGRLDVHDKDALKADERALIGPRPARIVANLPYNVATPLLIKWLSAAPWPPFFESLTLMFQREVAERICAKPGDPARGRLSVISQWRTRPSILFDVPARAFVPPPKVTSSVVRLEVLEKPVAEANLADLEAVTAVAFGQRRKMLRASLRQLVPDAAPWLESLGLDPTARPETLSVEQFCAMARSYRGWLSKPPPRPALSPEEKE